MLRWDPEMESRSAKKKKFDEEAAMDAMKKKIISLDDLGLGLWKLAQIWFNT